MLEASHSISRDPFGKVLPMDIVAAAVGRLNDIVMVTDATTSDSSEARVLYVNPAFERITGYKAEEILGRSVTFLRGPETSASEVLRIDALLAARRPVRSELLNYRKDGSKFWIEIEVNVVESGVTGQDYFVCIERDITERKLAEMALREHERSMATLFSNLPGMAYRCRNDGSRTTFFASAGSHELTGYLPSEFMGGAQPCYGDLIHPDDKQAVVDLIARHVARGEPYEVSYRIRTRGGNEKWVLDRGRAVPSGNASAVQLEGFISDVTERKLLESQVLHSQRLESIGTLAGGIAHDLNNIFAPIMMAGDLLADRMPDADSTQLIDAVAVSARRGAELVRQILLFARGLEGPRVSVGTAELFEELSSFLDSTFPKSIRVVRSVQPGLPAIAGDPTQLHQVLLNLCVNARDAMPEGGTLTISASLVSISPSSPRPHPDAVPGDFICIAITDTGCGIPSVIRNQIFDPFFTTKGVGRGTGLGLSTARSIVKSHMGFLTFDSIEGKGATFYVHLPAASSVDGVPELPGAVSGSVALPLPTGHGQHVLVVDDEESVRVIMRSTLETFGYRVSTALDGTEGIALAANPAIPIDLAVVDMQMPGLDGLKTLQAIRGLRPALPIVGASGLFTREQREQGAQSGVRLFLEKPFSVENLIRTVHAAISQAAP